MSRLRSIFICLLSVVLVVGQLATGASSAMAVEASGIMAAEGTAIAAGAEMPGECDACGGGNVDLAFCPTNCCASCSTVAALVPAQFMHGTALDQPRYQDAARRLLGISPSPHPTPPKRSVPS